MMGICCMCEFYFWLALWRGIAAYVYITTPNRIGGVTSLMTRAETTSYTYLLLCQIDNQYTIVYKKWFSYIDNRDRKLFNRYGGNLFSKSLHTAHLHRSLYSILKVLIINPRVLCIRKKKNGLNPLLLINFVGVMSTTFHGSWVFRIPRLINSACLPNT